MAWRGKRRVHFFHSLYGFSHWQICMAMVCADSRSLFNPCLRHGKEVRMKAARSLIVALGCIAAPALAQDTDLQEPGFGEISCLVEPGRQAALSSQVPGVIERIDVQAGVRVAAGDPLFSLMRDVESASVELERSRAAYASRRMQRNQRMIERNMLSESERDEIDTELRLARLQVNLANARLQQLTTRAPFDGWVSERLAEEGEFVDATPVLELVQLDPLRIEAALPLAAYGRIAAGDVIEVMLSSPVGQRYSAEVIHVDPVIDASSGTFALAMRLANPDEQIPAGIACELGGIVEGGDA
ncbi:efflux RND transporter periplasmic adaptor subunit [Halomonas sp. BN3-1]|uniref:efflux RND transporter periplasmic adaptor subunit n=1 Tax=unclassified Halomonas TaxID=2609666 RepID=UPI001F05F6AF|nr:efflux RND transporter periplasmic adaptor subunit [Halomonas sp. BN3-1]